MQHYIWKATNHVIGDNSGVQSQESRNGAIDDVFTFWKKRQEGHQLHFGYLRNVRQAELDCG